MHRFVRVALMMLVSLALTTPAYADRWVASWAASAHGRYPAGFPTAQLEMKFAFPVPE